MKKQLFLLLLLFWGINLFAQNYPSGSLLWKISGNELKEPSYLLGTFHLKSGDFLDSIPGAIVALDNVQQIVGEINMGNMQELQMQIAPAMMMSSDTTYQALYTTEDFDYVSECLVLYLGAGLEQMSMLKPAAIQNVIVIMAYLKNMPGFNPENAMDAFIQKKAILDGKPVVALETVESQIDVLFGSSLQRQADLLLCYLRNGDEIVANEITKLIEDYNNGNLNTIYMDSFQNEDTPCPPTPLEKDILLKNRNDQWMEKLPELMKEKSSFIAVGALHLAGEEGLLNQLQQSGYIVEPIFK